MSTTNPSEDDATHQHDSSDDEFKDADRCGCDECRPVDILRPQALAIPYDSRFRKAFVPQARTGGLSGIALREAIQESLQRSFQAHRVAMTSARVYTGQAEAGTSCQAEAETPRQALHLPTQIITCLLLLSIFSFRSCFSCANSSCMKST
jgi:hypothetical protein